MVQKRRTGSEERKSDSLDAVWTHTERCHSTLSTSGRDVVHPLLAAFQRLDSVFTLRLLRIPLPGLQDVQVLVKHEKKKSELKKLNVVSFKLDFPCICLCAISDIWALARL